LGRFIDDLRAVVGFRRREIKPFPHIADGEGALGFYDLRRQRYGGANPIPEAGEFQIGDYGAGGSPGQARRIQG
jgi:hypothetical protein